MRICLVILVAVTVIWAGLMPAQAAKRVALVIGNGAYSVSSLKNPVNDARDVARALGRLEFDVVRVFNADKREMIEALRRFEQKGANSDVALFYYAGHGMQVNGLNYLIPVGSDVANESEVEFEAIDVNRFLSTMKSINAGVNIIILDACRDNPFRGFRSSSRGLAVVGGISESIIVYSTAPGSVAADGAGRNSPFTRSLLSEIAQPGVEVKKMFNRVGADVARKTSGRQRPWISSSLYSDFYLTPGTPSLPSQMNSQSKFAYKAEPLPGAEWVEPETGMEFVWIPGGCYLMGSLDGEEYERPVHKVCLEGFWMGKYEVTVDQYRQFMLATGEAPGISWHYEYTAMKNTKGYPLSGNAYGKDNRQPMGCVNWYGAKAMAQWLSSMGNGAFRLPSEAEWEYAARGRGRDEIFSGSDDIDSVAWYEKNSKDRTQPVGGLEPNIVGLYDMSGNVWEWCEDVWKPDAYSMLKQNQPVYLGEGDLRIIRGGAHWNRAKHVRASFRNQTKPEYATSDVGFRLVREK